MGYRSRLPTRIGLIAGLLLALPTGGAGQGWLLETYAGVGVPTVYVDDIAAAGISGGVGGGWFFNRWFGVRADLAVEWLNEAGEANDDRPMAPGLPGEAFDLRLYHYHASVQVALLDSRATEWLLAVDFGAGATTLDFRGENVDGGEYGATRFTLPAGLTIGYRASEQVTLFVRGRWHLIFLDEAEFGNSTWSTLPIWAGIGVRAG